MLYSKATLSETAVVYSVESSFQPVSRRDLFADNRTNVSGEDRVPFWDVCETLADAAQPFDVLLFPDGQLRADTLQLADLRQYRTLILPDCWFLTPEQSQLLSAYLDHGGNLLILGGLGTNRPEHERQRWLSHANINLATSGFRLDQLPHALQLTLDSTVNCAIHIQHVLSGAAMHLIRYDYDADQDCVPVLPEIKFSVRLPGRFERAEIYSPNGNPEITLSVDNDRHHLTVRNGSLYTIVLLTQAVGTS